MRYNIDATFSQCNTMYIDHCKMINCRNKGILSMSFIYNSSFGRSIVQLSGPYSAQNYSLYYILQISMLREFVKLLPDA